MTPMQSKKKKKEALASLLSEHTYITKARANSPTGDRPQDRDRPKLMLTVGMKDRWPTT